MDWAWETRPQDRAADERSASACPLQASAWLQHLAEGMPSQGVALLTSQFDLLHLNSLARRIVDESGVIVVTGGRLKFRLARRDCEARAFASGKADQHGSALALRLDRPDGQGVIQAVLAIVASEGLILRLYEPNVPVPVSRSMLRQLYGLTSSEAEVAARLFDGLELSAVAAAMGVSRNTVRAHLRSIFRKCGVESQAQLLRQISLGPLQP